MVVRLVQVIDECDANLIGRNDARRLVGESFKGGGRGVGANDSSANGKLELFAPHFSPCAYLNGGTVVGIVVELEVSVVG